MKNEKSNRMKSSGVDIDLGNSCSKNAFSWAKKTFVNRKDKPGSQALGVDGSFSNLMDYGGQIIAMASDGIGTKIELAERTRIYNTLGFDLVAMVVDDLAANGIEPVNISNILDVDFLDYDVIDSLMKGLHDAAGVAGISVTGGEIAELGNRICGYGDGMHFNWCSTATGILPEGRRPVDGKSIAEGDTVISIASRGFRSNGFSMIRKVMESSFGDRWHECKYDDSRTWGEVLISPCIIYAPAINVLLSEKTDICGIAHITGGGLADNLGRVLSASGLGAVLDDVFEPHDFMIELQKLGKIEEKIAYRLWNMGNGMLLVVRPDSSEKTVNTLENLGYRARGAGRIVAGDDIEVHTRGLSPMVLNEGSGRKSDE